MLREIKNLFKMIGYIFNDLSAMTGKADKEEKAMPLGQGAEEDNGKENE